MTIAKEVYAKSVKSSLQKRFGYTNPMSIPKPTKVVISMGLNDAARDRNLVEDAKRELAALSGQHPIETKARRSIAGFKLREGQKVGLKVTLRGERMEQFMDRLFHIATPRIRDFRGFRRKGDGRGNYTLGIKDQQIFVEIDLDRVKRMQGMHITFVTTAKTDEECIALLEGMGLPFSPEKGGKKG